MPDPRIHAILASAAAARQQGQTTEERRLLDSAIAAAPRDPRVLNAWGMRALADRGFAAAAAHFAAATVEAPHEAALWMNLATARRGAGDDAGERVALDGALAVDRLNFMAQLRLAELNERTGLTVAAIEGWRGVLQMASGMDALPPALIDTLDRARGYLQRQTDSLATALDTRFGARMAADGMAARRVGACFDAVLGRRAIYHNQCAGLHVPFLPADEYFDRRHFPWLAAIEANTDAIAAEATALMANRDAPIRPYVRQDAGTPDNKWSALDRSLDWSAAFLWEYGVRNDAMCALCPRTAAALAAVPQTDIPGKAPTAFFSVLRAHAHIPAHTGVTNARTIIHLPLVVPEGCRFRVGGETRAWRKGEAFAFDDTIEHEAWNDSDSTRIVLIFDVWNPYLTLDERQYLREFFEITGRD